MINKSKTMFESEYQSGALCLTSDAIYKCGKKYINKISHEMACCKFCITGSAIFNVERGFRLFIKDLIVSGNEQARNLGETALLKRLTPTERSDYDRYSTARRRAGSK